MGEAGAEAPKKKNLHPLNFIRPHPAGRRPSASYPPPADRLPTNPPPLLCLVLHPHHYQRLNLFISVNNLRTPTFKTAMRMWAVSDPRKFTYRFKKSDKTRNNVVCIHAGKGCPFKVNATFSTLKECVAVIVVEDDHTCVGTAPVQRSIASTQAWLQEFY